jgi:hypothetical protein
MKYLGLLYFVGVIKMRMGNLITGISSFLNVRAAGRKITSCHRFSLFGPLEAGIVVGPPRFGVSDLNPRIRESRRRASEVAPIENSNLER